MTPREPLATMTLDQAPGPGQIATFSYTNGLGQQVQGLLVLHQGQLLAFDNLCPHWSIAMPPEARLLDEGAEHLVCPFHGARFSLEQGGRCVYGPPLGQRLRPLRVLLQPQDDPPSLQIWPPGLFG